MKKIYRIYLLVLSASMSIAVDAAGVEQKEKKEKASVGTVFHKPRRHSTGRTRHDVKKKGRPSPIAIEPRTGIIVNPGELTLQQQQDTPLMHAIAQAHYNEVETLLSQRVNLGAQNNFGETPLMRAAEYGNLPICQLLVNVLEKYDKKTFERVLNAPNTQGDTALIYAVRGGHVPVVEFLLDKGASSHISNSERQTPLMIAARRNDVKIVRVLLHNLDQEEKKKGIKIVSFELKQENDQSDTALQVAMRAHARGAEELLLKATGTLDYEALQLINAAKIGDVKKVRELVARKVNVNYEYIDQTPLIAAVMNDDPERMASDAPGAMQAIVTELLKAGAKPNVFDRFNYTPLTRVAGTHFDKGWHVRWRDAAQFSAVQCQIVEVLLAHGADINGVVKGHRSEVPPLIAAVKNYNLDVANLLIDRGADVCVKSHGHHVAVYVEAVIDKLRGKNELLFNEWITLLFDVDLGCNPIIKTPEGALFKAINHEDAKRVAELLAHHPRPNVEALFKGSMSEYTPLLLAIDHKNVAIVHELIKGGVNINREDQQGMTPLMIAIDGDSLESALVLLEAGAEVNIFDYNMNTVLMFFAESQLQDERSIHLLNALLRRGAFVAVRNGQGHSALDIVRENRHANSAIKEQIIKILQEAEEKEKKSRGHAF